ncbi:MAG: hypothetical protein B7Y39_12545 [Bdellovibrio sp. 28-41-41]|nr:MAG: hypothetical protein B7Y39_12545 [Bdellovibrio sp. 28-41-41]
MEKLNFFFSSWEFWGNAVMASILLGIVCGFIGIYVILHRIVFVSAAMSQVSSLGVMTAFLLVNIDILHPLHHSEDILPLVLATLLTGSFALVMARHTQAKISDRSKSIESLIGAVYLAATAGLLLIGDRVAQGAHDVANVLFGNAVAVDTQHLLVLAMICLPILLVHIWLRKDILFISYDPSMAKTLKYPVGILRFFLLISLGVIISIGTRTIGALPVFSFSVIPPMAALLILENSNSSFAMAALLGGASAFLGYLASFLFSFPTGACMTAITVGFLVIAKGINIFKRK